MPVRFMVSIPPPVTRPCDILKIELHLAGHASSSPLCSGVGLNDQAYDSEWPACSSCSAHMAVQSSLCALLWHKEKGKWYTGEKILWRKTAVVHAPASEICEWSRSKDAPSNRKKNKGTASNLFCALIKWKLGNIEAIGGKPNKVQNLYMHKRVIEKEFTSEERFLSFWSCHGLSHLGIKAVEKLFWNKINLFSHYVKVVKTCVLPKAFWSSHKLSEWTGKRVFELTSVIDKTWNADGW